MKKAERDIAILVNPTRGNMKAVTKAIEISSLLNGMDLRYTVYDKLWPANLEGFTDAWIVGGDGTVNWFANAYPEATIPLAVFAGGTGNDFHWMLYGHISIEKQLELVLKAEPKKADAGVCNGKLFMNGVGIGFDGAIVKDLVGKKKMPGKASYLLSVFKHLFNYREKACTIKVGNENIQKDCFMISIANAKRYGGGFMVAPNSIVDDGLLDLAIVSKISPLKRLKYLPVIEKGRHLHLPFIQYEQVKSVIISSHHQLHAHLDGEYLNASKFDINSSPGRFSFLY